MELVNLFGQMTEPFQALRNKLFAKVYLVQPVGPPIGT